MDDQAKARNTQAKNAFAARDVDQSKLAHLLPAHVEPNNDEGKLLKPIVFGGLDGVSTIFAFLAGAVGAELALVHTVAIGCAQLFAGALGMGFGEYISAKADQDVARYQQEREAWEVENNNEGEISEMCDIYKDKGMSEEDAQIVARTLSKYPEFWVEHMMLHEIGMFPPEDDSWQNVVQGVVMFLSFMILGGLPLVAYVLACLFADNSWRPWSISLSSSAALFVLGVVKANITSSQDTLSGRWVKALLEGGFIMMLQGLLCAGGAYLIGESLPKFLNLGE